MKITPDIIRHEFIGTEVKISGNKPSTFLGNFERIVNETRKTFTVSHRGKKRTIIKDLNVFQFRFSDGAIVEIEGKLLTGKPEDRLKKHIRRLW
jgi:ribonuclease P protein subunit POP4